LGGTGKLGSSTALRLAAFAAANIANDVDEDAAVVADRTHRSHEIFVAGSGGSVFGNL
jgi:hypothetical protein